MSRSTWTCSLSAFWPLVVLLFLIFSVRLLFALARDTSAAEGFSEEEVRFESGDVTLQGTVLVSHEALSGDSRKPAIALVHGAGPGPREQYRQEAEAFAREGLVTLIYDKRKKGYSQFERSYELLADDSLAAVRMLQAHPEVDRDAVGLWGLSEGGWVVPIAASHSEEVAFVVLVAATGVSPARQHSWNLENELRHQGVSDSMVQAISRTGTRLLVGAGVFAEANHDPVGPLEQVRQPVLALWGEKDRIEPPAESARILRGALKRGGNAQYTIRFFPDAEHGLHSSPDGFIVRERFVPRYPEMVASWVREVVRGEAPGPGITGPIPEQARLSHPLAPLAWWESGWVQLGAMVIPVLAFASYPTVAFGRWLRQVLHRLDGAQPKLPMRWSARCLAVTGTAALLGFVCYFGFLVFTSASAVGPVVAGRPLPWLALQALAVAACGSTVLLAASWSSARKALTGADRARIGVLLAGGVVFVAWAAYWGLFVP
jgi:dienelactone hydrolase